MKPGTGAIGCTAALALVTFIYFIYFGCKKHGVLGYLKSLAPAGVRVPHERVRVGHRGVLAFAAPHHAGHPSVLQHVRRAQSSWARSSLMATIFAQPLLEHFTAMNAVGALPSIAWLLILLIIYVVEFIVAFVQAYVFTVLAAVYIQIAEADAH